MNATFLVPIVQQTHQQKNYNIIVYMRDAKIRKKFSSVTNIMPVERIYKYILYIKITLASAKKKYYIENSK